MTRLLCLIFASAFVWCSHGIRLDFPQNLFANLFQKNSITADFKCINDGLFRNSESCEHYIQCSKGIPYERSCPNGLHFSIKTHNCEAPCDAHCDHILAEECGWKYSVRNVPDDFECIKDGLYKNSHGCDNYIQCSDGLAFEQSCPAGLHFNEGTERCEMPCDAHCDENIAEECGWVESNFTSNHVTLTPVELRCYEDGMYENHQDCGRYIVCSRGVAHEESCPEGLHFNSERKICEAPCDAHCDSTMWEHCGWPTPIRLITPDFICMKAGMYKNYRNCESYIQCVNGLPYELPCPGGLHFNTETKRCEEPCDAQCDVSLWEVCGRQALDTSIPEDFRCSGDGMYQNNGSCDTFILCSNGRPYIQQCAKGLHFGPKIQRCESPCIAHCDKRLAEECGWNRNLMNISRDFSCTEDGLYKNGLRCDSYIQCSNGRPLERQCPVGWHFNAKILRCEPPCEAHCDEKLAEECGWEKIIGEYEWEDISKADMADTADTTFDVLKSVGFMNCTEDERMAVPSECGFFIQCTKSKATIRFCPYLHHYNEETQRCLPQCIAYCDQTLAEECGWNSNHALRTDYRCIKDGLHPNPESCESYVHCYDGLPKPYSCPKGLHFNEETARCESPCDAHCDDNLAKECGWKAPYFRCPSENGDFGDLHDCSIYYSCENNIPIIRKCSAGTLFHYLLRKCVDEWQAKCIFHCPERDGKFAYRIDCQKYIQCTNNHPVVKRCPPGEAFDPSRLECLDREETSCARGSIQDHSRPHFRFRCPALMGKFPNVEACNMYWDCVYHVPLLRSCGKKLYNPETRECDDPKNVSCPPYESHKKVVCYFSNNATYPRVLTPEDMDPYLCTHIHYTYAHLDPKTLRIIPSIRSRDIGIHFYKRLISLKRMNQKLKILLSLGGWEDSHDTEKYSELLGDCKYWIPFAKDALVFLKKYGFDGLEIDWEFPVCSVPPCSWNIALKREEKLNFSFFLNVIRTVFNDEGGRSLILSVKVAGKPDIARVAYDVETIIKSVDYIVVMAYLLPGENQTVTMPPSRLYPRWEPGHLFEDAASMMHFWNEQGAPRQKLILGERATGRMYRLQDEKSHGIYANILPQPPPKDISYYEVCELLRKQQWHKAYDAKSGPYIYRGDSWIGYQNPIFLDEKSEFAFFFYGGVALTGSLSDDYSGQCCRIRNPLLKALIYRFVELGRPPNTFGCP